MKIKGLGARLRKYRLRKGLSLQKLADAVQASKAHIYELETGRSANPSLALLIALSRELDAPIKDLVGESSEVGGEEAHQLAPLFRDLRELPEDALDLIQALTNKLREQQKDDNKPDN
jgi:transcriptional regulator with XRE-family HTH domain